MKLTKCKRCDAPDLYWVQASNGKWFLLDKNNEQHRCDDDKLKMVKCKYCNADDLHWAEDVNPLTKEKKAVLSESYGLPHACDERIAFIAKEKQDKKDNYEAEKKRINAHPDGECSGCKGSGHVDSDVSGAYSICYTCCGNGWFSDRHRKSMLATVRQKIWPNMKDNWNRMRR